MIRTRATAVLCCIGILGGILSGSERAEAGQPVVEVAAGLWGIFEVDAVLNEQVIARVLVDTGASDTSILCRQVSDALHLTLGAARIVQTANGYSEEREGRLRSVRIGSIVLDDVTVFVGEQRGGCLVLLGLSFLQRLQSVHINGGRMTLTAWGKPLAPPKTAVAERQPSTKASKAGLEDWFGKTFSKK